MKIKLIKSTFFKEKETKEKLSEFIIKSNKLSMGDECLKFENEFARYHGNKYACLVNSGSSANLLLIQALLISGKLKKGDNIGVSGLTWSTNIMPLFQLGLNPVPIDVELDTLNVGLKSLIEVHSKNNLKGFFITNLLGLCSNLLDIVSFCENNKILLFEDNCESLGSVHKNRLLGTFGIASTSSFYVGHHLSTIEGGMIITDDDEIYNALLISRAHGWSRNLSKKNKDDLKSKYQIENFYNNYTFYDLGFNLRPTEITGFLGNYQIKFLKEMVNIRENNFNFFSDQVVQNNNIINLKVNQLEKISNFAYPLIFKSKSMYKRYREKFQKNNVEIRPIVSGNITEQPFFKKYSSLSLKLKNASYIHENGFYFPNNPELTNEEKYYIKRLLE